MPADLEDPSQWQQPAPSGGGNMIWIVTIGALVALLAVVIWKTGILDRDKKDRAAAERREEKLKAWKAAKVKYGNLEIRTEPDEAQVFMKIGKAPASVPKLDIGLRNWLLIEHEGYKSERVVVRPDQWKPTPGVASDAKETHRAEISVTLRPEKAEPLRRPPKGKGPPGKDGDDEPPVEAANKYGVLRVNATPEGATVWVLTGYTPSMAMTNLKISDQEYEFKVVKEHYLSETLRIAQGDWRQSGEDYAFSRLLPLRPDPNDPPEGAETPDTKAPKAKKEPARKGKRR